MNSALASQLDACADAWRQASGVPGLVSGLLADEQLQWSRAVGWADAAEGTPMKDDRLFRIGSITKTFVAAAIMQLRDEGRLTLEDPLVQHVPELRRAHNLFGPIEHVTLRETLRHTAGLPRELPVGRPGEPIARSDRDFRAALGQMRLTRAPGTAHQYSNVGYRMLGHAVEAVSGRSFADYIDVELLAPLGMRETACAPSAQLAERCARGHWARGDDEAPHPHAEVEPSVTGGEGALWSTLGDMARWIGQQQRTDAQLRRGPAQVLDGATLAEMHRPLVLADAGWATAWGLGWSTVQHGEHRFHGHNGSFAGFQAYAAFCPDARLGAIALANGHANDRPMVGLCGDLLALGRAARASDVTEPAGPSPPTPAAWSELLGEYVWPELRQRICVVVRQGRLVCDDARVAHELTSTADEPLAFEIAGGPLQGERVCFFRAGDGAIAHVNVAGYGYRRTTRVPCDA